MVLLSLIPLPRPPVTVPFMPPVGPPVMLLFSFKFTHPSPLHPGLRVTVGTDDGKEGRAGGVEKGCLSRADPAERTPSKSASSAPADRRPGNKTMPAAGTMTAADAGSGAIPAALAGEAASAPGSAKQLDGDRGGGVGGGGGGAFEAGRCGRGCQGGMHDKKGGQRRGSIGRRVTFATIASPAEASADSSSRRNQSATRSHHNAKNSKRLPALASAAASTGKDIHGGSLTIAHADIAGSCAAGAANATILSPPAADDGAGGEGGQGQSERHEATGGGEGGQDGNAPFIKFTSRPMKRSKEGDSLISSASHASEPTA